MNLSAPRQFFWWMVSFIGGVFIASFFNFWAPFWALFLFGGAWLASFALKKLRLANFILGLLVFATAGAYLYQVKSTELSFWREEKIGFNESAQTRAIQGRIASEFERRQKNARFIFRTEGADRILVFTNRYPRLRYGDKLRIEGKVQIPGQVEDFDWQGYLASQDVYKVMFYPELEVLKPGREDNLRAYIYLWRAGVRRFFQENFSSYKSQMLRAIILGDKAISDAFRDKLSYSGTNHLVAISGLHVSIFALLCLNLGVLLGLSKKKATIFALVVVALFVFQIGFRASAIRAAIMGSLLFLGYGWGRPSQTEHLLVLAGFLMLCSNPLLLRFDVGFQLSFLAVLGIAYFKPLFEYLFQKIPSKIWGKDFLIMTLGAQLGVIPLISYNFGRLSYAAPLANVLILYFMPFLMTAGFGIAILSLVFSAGAKILGLGCLFLLDYILGVIDFFGKFSFLHTKVKLSIFALLGYYVLLVLFIIWWQWYYRRNLTPAAQLRKV